MAISDEERHELLQNESESDTQESLYTPKSFRTSSFLSRAKSKTSLTVFSLLSASTNILLAFAFISLGRQCHWTSSEIQTKHLDASPYTGLGREPGYKFPYSTGYGPEITNHTLANEIWEAIDIDGGVVAIPYEWAAEHNLPASQPFPWDKSKGTYVLNSFHTIHCLKNIHRLIYDLDHGLPHSEFDVGHVLHCLDNLRIDVMCEADDWLLPTPGDLHFSPGPRGQSRVCKNWDALVGWAAERDACYQHLTDDEVGFAQVHEELERYLNCKPDSPYAKQVAEYIESRGGDLKLPKDK